VTKAEQAAWDAKVAETNAKREARDAEAAAYRAEHGPDKTSLNERMARRNGNGVRERDNRY